MTVVATQFPIKFTVVLPISRIWSMPNKIATPLIGRLKLDKVAYIRYASVYKNFTETKDFEDFISLLTKETK